MTYFHGRSYDLTVYKDDEGSLSELGSTVPDFTTGIGGSGYCNLIDWTVAFTPGDILKVTAPSIPDATLPDLYFTFQEQA